jgi:Dolichyl-phosphate-mannose-protein mannosyltransferase
MDLTRIHETLREQISIPNVSALCFLVVTLLTAGRYGFYGDELYYIACSKHLDFGYVDHPPMVALLTFVERAIFGETKFGLRFMSGLAGAFTVLFSAKIAEALGGGKLSKSLAALSICFATAFPAMSSFFSMNPVDIALCTAFIYLLLKTIAEPSPQKWIGLGILLCVGLLNKYTFLVLGFSALVSLMITKRRDVLQSPWFYCSGVIALVIFLPHVVWQIQNGWPTLEFMHNAAEFKNLSLSPFAFLLQLIIGLNPCTLPLWLSGLVYLLIRKEAKEFRFLGWMAVVFLLVYLVQNSKIYYVFPIFPLLLSSGAVAVERFSLNYRVSWPKWAIGSAMIISGTILMPLAVPILPVPQFVSYAKSLGLWNMIRMEKGEGDVMPIHFVYRLGWEELVDSVSTAYDALPPGEKGECAILGSWYGVAGAIDHFGPEHGLPNAICPRNNYWIWGPRNYSGNVVLAVGYDDNFLKQFFDSVDRVSYFRNPYAYDYAIYLCKKPKASLGEMWPRLKRFI